MLSDRAKNIIKDVGNLHKNTDIKFFLQKYDKLERDFIQKYVETKIAFFSIKIAHLAYLFSLLAVILSIVLSISLFFYPEYCQKYKFLYTFLLIVLCILFFIVFYLLIKELTKKNNVFEDIIISIEDDDKLIIDERGESIVVPKPDEIRGKVDIPSNNGESDISSEDIKINKSDVQLKFHQILEEHRWVTNLIWNKIYALIIVNGILFSAFNLLVIADSKSDFLIQKVSLIIVGFLISIFWLFVLNHSIIYKENYRDRIFQIQQDYPEFSINFIDEHHSWRGMFGINNVSKISAVGVSVLWLVLLCGLKIGFL